MSLFAAESTRPGKMDWEAFKTSGWLSEATIDAATHPRPLISLFLINHHLLEIKIKMLMQLPVEIIIAIAEELDDKSRYSLSATCREFYNLLLPYNELHLNCTNWHAKHLDNFTGSDKKCGLVEALKKIVYMPLLARRIVYVT